MDVKIADSWKKILSEEFKKSYFTDLVAFVKEEYKNHIIYPKGSEIFKAFDACSMDEVKVVIIGQDPYHGEGQANGLCFSVAKGMKVPPSLKNIYKELLSDVEKEIPAHGDLSDWSRQGVLLLNATLTVRAKTPGSHQKKGWEEFTDAVIQQINAQKENVVFMLWGAYAQKKGAVIDREKHLVLSSPHPSPFSAHKGFLGNSHFSQCNAFLKSKDRKEIAW